MSFQFWRRWLIVVTLGVIVFGVDLVLLSDTMQNIFNSLYFPTITLTEEARQIIRFDYVVLGAVMIGWGVTLLMVVLNWFHEGERKAWNTIATSVVVWFVIDSIFSIYSGAPGNALLNLGFFILFAIPLAATRQTATNARTVRVPSA